MRRRRRPHTQGRCTRSSEIHEVAIEQRCGTSSAPHLDSRRTRRTIPAVELRPADSPHARVMLRGMLARIMILLGENDFEAGSRPASGCNVVETAFAEK